MTPAYRSAAASQLPHAGPRDTRRLAAGALLAALAAMVLALSGCKTAPPAQGGLTPAQVAVLQQEGFTETDVGWELGRPLKVLFGFDEDAIPPDRIADIRRLGGVLLGVGIAHVRVDGHTDHTGSTEYNLRLSLRRAEAVARVLVTAGFEPANIEVRGMGKSRPVADNRTAAGRAENRRASIVVTVE
ncbi:OmpA family protein [Cupriavidus pinatubonensis]|uniref:Peptidoglycan-associated lipoprotein n=1 Tax=Cupriavidus pinatubonensis TaxID=248026 RepID=A0ABM8X8C3_9BURK|nr:OmpA family protein [Cupriavidus pinatubonensis]CAG9176222.1 Peptidoglycan-associated lipoprotein [Cupriavidus pinatubonensis]